MATQAKRDYYEVLGIERSAQESEIKTAYRKLAMQFHPDRNPDNPQAEEKFKEASEAYSVLIDSEKRARYDQFGHAGLDNGAGFGGFDAAAFTDFSDLFGNMINDFFGVNASGGRRTRAQKGGDVRADVTLTFEEAAFGKKTEVRVRRHEACERCGGSGTASSKGPSTCSTCRGYGQVSYQQSFFSVARTCPACGGAGRVITDPCAKCKGDGRVLREHVVEVAIPAGVDNGNRMRLQQEGDAGFNGGPQGDLYVVLHVKPHPFFEREGQELFCSVPISFVQAALGAEVMIPTLDGEHKLKIPEGTQSGTVIRVRGKGLPDVNARGSKGDMHVQVKVVTPSKLTRRQRELLDELAASFAVENKPQPRGLFEKVKDIFG